MDVLSFLCLGHVSPAGWLYVGLFWLILFTDLVAIASGCPLLKLEKLAIGTPSFTVFRDEQQLLFPALSAVPQKDVFIRCTSEVSQGHQVHCSSCPSQQAAGWEAWPAAAAAPDVLGPCCSLPPLCLPPRLPAARYLQLSVSVLRVYLFLCVSCASHPVLAKVTLSSAWVSKSMASPSWALQFYGFGHFETTALNMNSTSCTNL